MPLVTIRDLTIRFRGPALLDGVDCVIEPGQRIGLLGRNGAGKTTLLKLLSKQLQPDNGNVDITTRVALLPQEVPQNMHGSVAEIVSTGVDRSVLLDEDAIEWQIDHKVDQILSRMGLDPEAAFEQMSSGMKRRVLLARALVDQPELLLLDEPTNHLDIDAIRWLEDFLARWGGAFVFITHDRQFLRKLATRILEIDRGKLLDWTCDYDTFLKRKQEALDAEEKQNALFDKKLAQEEVWIRQGIKARRTRNEGRVRALKELRLVRGERREKVGTSQLQIQEGARSGTLVVHAESVAFAHRNADQDQLSILVGFTTTIMRGDKVGIIGPNGAGKTTLLKILLGEHQPQAGKVRTGTNLQIAYFDQLRAQLDGEKTVEQDVSDGYQTIEINGSQRHILGYLQDFLFTPDRARTQIKLLSGGERNRVLLAKLFAKPANVIVLDEPTNDLDAETLEMLEERLVDYSGTLLIVSHDREFLNNVVTSCIVFETPLGEEEAESAANSRGYVVREYVGGYDEWQRQRALRSRKTLPPTSPPSPASGKELDKSSRAAIASTSDLVSSPVTGSSAKPTRRKLSFKEVKELESLPAKIEQLEAEIAQLHATMADPAFYKSSGPEIAKQQSLLAQAETQLAEFFARWEELEASNS